MSNIQHDQQLIMRQEAFQALIVSLRTSEPPRKPAAVVGLIEEAELEEFVDERIECEDCGGTGGDRGAVDGWEPCSHCRGSGLETPKAPALAPVNTVPAMIGADRLIVKRGVVSIGPGMFVRTGRRK
jgi:hypothetical protein